MDKKDFEVFVKNILNKPIDNVFYEAPLHIIRQEEQISDLQAELLSMRCCGNCHCYIFEPWETGFHVCFNTGRSQLPYNKCEDWEHRSKDKVLVSAEICQIVDELRKELEMDSLPEGTIFSKVREYSTATTDEQIRSALIKKYARLRGVPPIWFIWRDDKNKEIDNG